MLATLASLFFLGFVLLGSVATHYERDSNDFAAATRISALKRISGLLAIACLAALFLPG